MVTLKEYQKRVLRKLKADMIDLLNASANRKVLVFKSPTGSGKTLMASALLEQLTAEIVDGGDCIYSEVAFIWLAPQKLHIQSYQSMQNYFSETRSLHPMTFDEVDIQSGLHRGDVLFLNWASVNKDNAVIIRDNEQNRNIGQLVTATRQNNIPIVMIIDEEHYYAGKDAEKSQLFIQRINPKVELRISATPHTTNPDAFEAVAREDVIAEEMIKKQVILNPNIVSNSNQENETVDMRLLDTALDRRRALSQMYKEAGSNVNPLLLIQLPNDSKEDLDNIEQTMVEVIENHLREKGISVENGKLGIWLSKRHDFNEQHISDNDNLTEVLIFKQAIALGWDCPRAAVLLVFREWKSMTFSTQVVGRVLRMPERRHYTNESLNVGYVYTNLTQKYFDIKADEANYISTIHAQKRMDLPGFALPSVYQEHPRVRNRLGYDFRKLFMEEMQHYFDFSPLELFDPNDFEHTDNFLHKAEETMPSAFTNNRQKARTKGVQTDVTRIFVEIPKDIEMPSDTGRVEIVESARLAVNNNELDYLLTRFCKKHIAAFAPYDSIPVLKGALAYSLEQYLGFHQFEAVRVILYNQNRDKFAHIIDKALDRYKARLKVKSEEVIGDTYHQVMWQIPDTLTFNTDTYHAIEDYRRHYLLPYFEQKNAYDPEKQFSHKLDYDMNIDWWYKNGDNGKQHFAIPYTDIDGNPRCFYVDYIFRLTDGTIGLFDTKTEGSDKNGVQKHNALLEYIKQRNENSNVRYIGGLLIKKENTNNWYYSPTPIENTTDISGWSLLDLDNINSDNV